MDSKSPAHDKIYYFPDLVTFLVGDRLFRVPKHMLVASSPIFSVMFSLPHGPNDSAEGQCDEKPSSLRILFFKAHSVLITLAVAPGERNRTRYLIKDLLGILQSKRYHRGLMVCASWFWDGSGWRAALVKTQSYQWRTKGYESRGRILQTIMAATIRNMSLKGLERDIDDYGSDWRQRELTWIGDSFYRRYYRRLDRRKTCRGEGKG
ncbi:hypothetical protein BU17DRAFT_70663 [Hysterangium stoloniferum]|nr:hypothetical protein BU17DRAFT_70663 [Hysterangium stoloniferum]